jgi:PAS domain S-box-containing protein
MNRPLPSHWAWLRLPAIAAGWAVVTFLIIRYQTYFPISIGPRWLLAGAFGIPLLAYWFGGWWATVGVTAAALAARGDGTFTWAETFAGVVGMLGGELLLLVRRPRGRGLFTRIDRPEDALRLTAALTGIALLRGTVTGFAGLFLDPADAARAAAAAAAITWLTLALIIPLAVVLWTRGFPAWRGGTWVAEGVIGLAGVLVGTAVLFADGPPVTRDLPFPVVVLLGVFGTWVTFRFDVVGTAVVTLVVFIEILLIATIRGGPEPLFPPGTPWGRQAFYLVLIAGLFFTQLLVAAAVRAWAAQADRLAELNAVAAAQAATLRESDDRLKFALKSAGMVAWDVDVVNDRVVRSESLRAWMGLPAADPDLTVDEFLARVHPDDVERVRASMPRFRTGDGERIEYRIVRGDGSVAWLSSSGRPVVGPDGRVTRAVGVHRDITAERTSRDELLLYQSAVVHAHDAVVILDGSPTPGSGRHVRYVNDAFCKMTGYDRDEVLGRSLHKLLSGPGTDAATLDAMRGALDAGRSHRVELLNYKKDKTTYWVDLAFEPVRIGDRLDHWVMIQRDVTWRRTAEDRLRESEAKFRGIFENAWAGVSITDAAGVFVAVNPQFAQMLGRRVEDVLGHIPREFSHEDDWEAEEPHRHAVRAGDRDRYRLQKRYKRPDGTTVTTDLWFVALRDDDRAYRGGLGISVDVTEQLRLEEQLRQAQKMEAFGQLAGGVAHDFNNLLTAVLGNLSLVKLSPGDPNRALLAAAELAGSRAADLTRKLLGYARRSHLYLAPVRVGEVIDEVVGILRRTLDPRIVIRTEVGPTPPVRADATLVNQVLFNLCLNSRDAIDGPGEVVVSAEAVAVADATAARIPDARPGAFVRVSVRDTGRGMDEDVRRRIFEPFFTTKAVGQGTGLGLAMVHGIMKQHGGWVACDTKAGAGTRFDLYFPVSAMAVRAAEPPAVPPPPAVVRTPPPRTSRGTVLLVDDEALIRNVARAVLESAGFAVVEAEDGIDAVEKFRDAPPGTFGLVILDLTMPRMSGRDAFRQILDLDPAACILFSSGYSNDDVSELAGAAGMLTKPYRPDNLLAAVRKALAREVVEV